MANKKEPFILTAHRQIKVYLEDRKKQLRYRRFYLSSKEDTRGQTAKIADFFIGRVLIFFLIFMGTFLYYQEVYVATLMTAALFSVYHFVGVRLRNWKLEGIKDQKRQGLANKKIYQDLVNKTEAELKKYLEEFYTKMGCTELTCAFSSTRQVIYQGSYQGQRLQLVFYAHKGDYQVEVRDVKEMFGEMKQKEIYQGLLLSTADFTQESYHYAETVQAPYQLRLFNREKLLQLMKKNGLVPSEEEIDALLESQIRKRENQWEKYKKAALAKHKMRNYLVLSLFLFVAGFYTPYPLYYYAMSGMSMSMMLLTMIAKVWDKTKSTEEHALVLNEIFKEV